MIIKYWRIDFITNITHPLKEIDKGDPIRVRADIRSEFKMNNSDKDDDRIANLLFGTNINNTLKLPGKNYEVYIEFEPNNDIPVGSIATKEQAIQWIKDSWKS